MEPLILSVNKTWEIVLKFSCPAKFIQMVCQFYDGLMVKVLDGSESSKAGDPKPRATDQFQAVDC